MYTKAEDKDGNKYLVSWILKITAKKITTHTTIVSLMTAFQSTNQAKY